MTQVLVVLLTLMGCGPGKPVHTPLMVPPGLITPVPDVSSTVSVIPTVSVTPTVSSTVTSTPTPTVTPMCHKHCGDK